MLRRSLLYAASGLPLLVAAQPMTLSNGTITVMPGTHITLVGPVTWTIDPTAAIVNDGEIDLGTEGLLEESIGGPITGSGVEKATRTLSAPFTSVDLGGLGLTLSLDQALGEVTITRGHLPIVLPNSAESVARWYRIASDDLPGAVLGIDFQYDPSGLNGLDAATLQLHEASDLTSYWSPLVSIADVPGNSVFADQTAPWSYVTAFEAGVVTNLMESLLDEFQARPTITEGSVQIISSGKDMIRTCELFDASGRELTSWDMGTPGVPWSSLDLSLFSAGSLLLRINSTYVVRIHRL